MAFNVAHEPTRHTSFWGECTATLDWCEENYHLTPFIAEFWNSISNFGYIVVGLIGAVQCHRIRSHLPLRYAFLFLWMALIGVGSLMFHATLKYSMQLLDEIPMLFSNSQTLYCLWHPETNLSFANKYMPVWVRRTPVPYFAFSLLITALYVSAPTFTLFFQVSYGAMIVLMALSLHFYACDLESKYTPTGARSIRALLNRSAVFMLAAFALWNVDNVWCDRLRSLRVKFPVFGPWLQMHAWWHLLTMISGTHTIVATITAWCKQEGGKGHFKWQMNSICSGIIPWMTVESINKISETSTINKINKKKKKQ